MSLKSLVFLLLLSSALSEDAEKSDRNDFKKSLSRDCASSYSLTCLKLDLVSWVDKLNEQNDFALAPGISVVRENSGARSNTADIVAELARDFPNDPEARLDVYLLKKVQSFLSTHSLKLDLWNNDNDAEARGGGGGGGGGGGKKGGGLIYLLLGGAMMKATLAAVALKGLALLAAKALFTAVISLVITSIIGLKSLTHHHHGHHSYEVVAKHGHHHDEHDRYSPYRRSFEQVPLPLGLQDSYQPPK